MKLFFLLLFLSVNSWAINVSANIKGTVSEVATIQKIIPRINEIVNSDAFHERILKSKFTYTKLSNEEIYQKIINYHWKLDLAFEKQGRYSPFTKSKCKSNVLGWTYPSVKTVWFNRCNFQGRKESGIAGTIAHEASHKMGFSHPFESTKTRPQSVPYSVGTILAEMYK